MDMKSLPRLIRRYISILIFSGVLLLILNLILLWAFVANQASNAQPWKMAQEVAAALQRTADGGCRLPEETALGLEEARVWAVFIDNGTSQVLWSTANLPESIPMSYTLSDIAGLTRGYVDGYPTFPATAEDGIIVLGYPKDSFWKHMWPSWDYDLIANLPRTVLLILAVNIGLIFLIYMTANSRLLRSIRPIVDGIRSLPGGEPVYVKERGLLAELAMNINKTSEILQMQKRQLRRKETARANWIAGVSHDIRTPLSMVMGYAGQLREDGRLPGEAHRKAETIVRQSERMRNLINDLNLASKLEYNMQPVAIRRENLVAMVRQVVVDFMNMDTDGRYPIEWETEEGLVLCPVDADGNLVKRAVSNLIQNCMNHNEEGCRIYVRVRADEETCSVTVSDDGIGATDEQIERLESAPHYMVCDEDTTQQRHGLGLLIVRQIAAAHGGTVRIGHSPQGGFLVEIGFGAAGCMLPEE